MNREDIYDHLAQVYIGKRKSQKVEDQKTKKREFGAWLLINIIITIMIFSSAVYGLTAFLTRRGSSLRSSVIFDLYHGPVKLEYNFNEAVAPTKSFSLTLPPLDAGQYSKIHFRIRAREEGSPGVVKIVFRNKLNEEAVYYLDNVNADWKECFVDLSEFKQITDWMQLKDLSFTLESWNVENKKGVILIEDIYFSS